MRLIYEENIEHTDYLELIMTVREAQSLLEEPITREYKEGKWGPRRLSILVRLENQLVREEEKCH